MKEKFDFAFNLTVLRFEGGGRYTNDPDDPGGETKWGLSKNGNPDLDIANLTKQDAWDIYRKRYWDPCRCDEMPYPWDVIVFDTAVNLGVSRAVGMKGKSGSPCEFHMLRIRYYTDLVAAKPIMQKYIRGWVNRVIQLWTETKQEA
jgi:hypothetical protein